MSDDLKQRVVTAVVLLVALIALTLLTTPLAFAAVVAVIIMLAAWEWGAFAQFEGVALRLFYTLSVLIALVGAAALSGFWSSTESFTLFRVILILCFGVLWWCIAACLLVGYPENSACWNHKFTISLMGLLALVPTWTGLVALKVVLPSGYLVLGVVIAVAGVDVGAYFAGRYLGNRPLAPSVSPKKTWEGVWGGFATCCAVSAVLVWAAQRDLLELSSAQILVLLLSCITTTPFAVVGDLVESMLKRNSDLKDSGSTSRSWRGVGSCRWLAGSSSHERAHTDAGAGLGSLNHERIQAVNGTGIYRFDWPQHLDVVSRCDNISVFALSAYRNSEMLLSQCLQYEPRYAVLVDPEQNQHFKRLLASLAVKQNFLTQKMRWNLLRPTNRSMW